MAIIKCKMCGGDLKIPEGSMVAECEYCGSRQTVPTQDNEKKLNLIARANRLRAGCEFDKAAEVFESIVAEFPTEAEAYWGLVLCKYGIEYVDDPGTGKKIPTCHRSSFDSVLEDADFEQACENADVTARKVYREEAKAIEDLRQNILKVSGKEKPYDIFICYKETDEKGDRTVDSVMAQEVYNALTEKGYRVFFSRVSLEDKLGVEYEPYIFAALNSAKVMLVFGTDYENFNAVWVKNEWKRFLALTSSDHGKVLIPCYKDIDAYDMPKEFAHLQAQDMGKVGAMQDLLRGIEKIFGAQKKQPAASQPAVQAGGPSAASLLERGNMELEDGDWDKAKERFDQVLNIDPKSAEAYLGVYMAENRISGEKDFEDLYTVKAFHLCIEDRAVREPEEIFRRCFDDRKVERAWQFAGDEMKKRFCELTEATRQKAEELRPRLAQAHKRVDAARNIVCLGRNLFGLKADGTVVAARKDNRFGQRNVSGWRDIAAIAAGVAHTVGLKADGTVVAVGDNESGESDVSSWRDIVAIAAGCYHTVGLKSTGRVVAAGGNREGQCNVSGWRDIVAIAACGAGYHTVGLKADGTVVAVGDNEDGACDVSGWRDIVAIAAGRHTVGLKADGTVVAAGNNSHGQCDVSSWRDIVAIATGDFHTVGLKADGTVVAVGDNEDGACDVSGWRDIVAIGPAWEHTVGLKADGTVVVAGKDSQQINEEVRQWKLFNHIDTLEQEREEHRRAAEERQEKERKERREKERAIYQRRHDEVERERTEIQRERDEIEGKLSNLKGLFAVMQRRELQAELTQLDEKLGNCDKKLKQFDEQLKNYSE